ncbi:hypothetical protein Tco_1115879 [Tanacetum coccineum]
MRELGYPGNIKLLSDVKVDILPQPWRTFGTIINKCLSGKVTGIDSLRLSRAQILWGLYHQQKVDYAYLLWEDLVFQIENKESRKNKYMFYLRFTKVVINHFMSQDQSIPRRNKVDWHMANDDPILTTMRFIPQHEVTYYAFATGNAIPKPKYVRQTTKEKTVQAPKASSGKRIKSAAKVTKSEKKKQPAQGLKTLSEIALSHASGSSADEGTGVKPGVPDVPSYDSKDEEISWKSSDDEGDDDASKSKDDQDDAYNDSERTKSNNDGDKFVHLKFTTHDEEDKEEESFNSRVHTPSLYEYTDDEAYDKVAQSGNAKEEKMDEERTNKEAEVDTLYRDMNVNLEGRETKITDAPCTIVQTTQVIEDTHVIITPVNPEGQQQSSSVSSSFISNMLNPSPNTGIDSIFNLNTESTSLVDVLVMAIVEPPLLSFSIPGIIDAYLANKMHEAVKTAVQLQSERLRDEAQTENADFINKLDDNIKKIIKNQVKEQVKAQTSHAIAANLSELELKKILINKMESNKSIYRSDEQKDLYKALVDAYESDKLILDTYGDIVSFKRHRDDEDKDEESSVRSNRGSKRRRAGKEPESTSAPKEKTSKTTGKSTEGSKSHHKSAGESAQAEEPMHIAKDLEEPAHQEFKIGVT